MPAKNTIKIYIEGAYYHLYNRGANKQVIFHDEEDYLIFLSFLKFYLSPPTLQGLSLKATPPSRLPNNFADKIDLLSFCLMSNHFHLQVKQYQADSINFFMRSLLTRYSLYYNKKYNHSGHLYQGPYKAVMITSEPQLVYLTKYIHLNPYPVPSRIILEGTYSSLPNYLGKIAQSWVKPKEILNLFSKSNPKLSYENFINNGESPYEYIKEMVIDEDI